MLYAQAQRQIDDFTERYIWLIDAPIRSDSDQIFLSNQNLLSGNLPVCSPRFVENLINFNREDAPSNASRN
jgi:hypothetical protein